MEYMEERMMKGKGEWKESKREINGKRKIKVRD